MKSPSNIMRQSSLTKLGSMINTAVNKRVGNGDIQWCFSQVKGTLEDDVTEADIISCVEFNHDGDLLATGDKGGRVVIFQRDPVSKNSIPRRGEYNVYSTFQSHEPEFDYLKSLEIEEKINKIRWLKRKNPAHFLLSTNDKTIKLWKVSERDKRVEGYNTKEENGSMRDPACITSLRVPTIKPMELMVEASPRRIFANAHTYHINSISVNSDQETYLSADDLRINLWHLEITDQSFSILLPYHLPFHVLSILQGVRISFGRFYAQKYRLSPILLARNERCDKSSSLVAIYLLSYFFHFLTDATDLD